MRRRARPESSFTTGGRSPGRRARILPGRRFGDNARNPPELPVKVGDRHYRSLWAEKPGGPVHIIDQTQLPHAFETRVLDSPEAAAEAIETMRVRGAPLIGVAAAFGLALAMSRDPSDESLARTAARLAATRPDGREPRLGDRDGCARRSRALPRASGRRRRGSRRRRSPTRTSALNEAIGRHGLALIEREHAAHRRVREHPHPLQRGLARDRRLGHRARAHLHGPRRGHPRARVGGRDAPAQPGAAHRLGARGPRRAAHADRRQRRRPPHAARPRRPGASSARTA